MFGLFFTLGKNISLEVRGPEIFASVEMEPDISGEAVDRAIAPLTAALSREPGLNYLRTESRKGSAELNIGFDETQVRREQLADRVAALGDLVPGGFVYVPDRTETGGGAQNSSRTSFLSRWNKIFRPRPRIETIEVTALGNDAEECRRLAVAGAQALGRLSQTVQTVLNFKQPEETVYFFPNADRIAAGGTSLSEISSVLRWLLFGPVVDKWIQDGDEKDIRVAGRDLSNADLNRLANLSIPLSRRESQAESKADTETDGARPEILSMRLEALGRLELLPGTGKIYRRDGRRAAYFTVHLQSSSTEEAARVVKAALAGVPVPRGCGFVLSRDIQFLSRQYQKLLAAFLASVAGILLLLTALTEDFFKSLIIISIIPVSCVFPLMVKFFRAAPLEMGDIVGMVIIGGISVNNGIFLTESRRSRPLFCLREKIPSLLAASLTTIAGAVPLILAGGEGFSRTLAESLLWGTFGSLVVSVVLFPCLLKRS
jgi:multidrug efflux pump subunit AcrB